MSTAMGRKTATVPAAMRKAVVARDEHCAYPFCDRPPGWCDAHHIHHWADGGETKLSNLVLLCRRHHREMHGPRAMTIEMVNGRPRFLWPGET